MGSIWPRLRVAFVRLLAIGVGEARGVVRLTPMSEPSARKDPEQAPFWRNAVVLGLVAIVFSSAGPLQGQARPRDRVEIREIRAAGLERIRVPVAGKTSTSVGRDRATVTVPLEGRDRASPGVYRVKSDRFEALQPKTTAEAISLEIAAGEIQYIRSQPPPPGAASLSRARPALLLGRLFAGVHREGGGIDARAWDLVLAAESPPAVWNAEKAGYAMRFVVGLQPAEESDAGRGRHGAAEIDLPRPITVIFERRNAEIDPNETSIARTGVDGYQTVDFLCKRRDLPATVTARSNFGETPPLEVEIAARCADLVFDASPREILGLGLGTVEIGVTCFAEDGSPLVRGRPLEVTLEAERGILSPATITVPAGAQRAVTTLRSSGLGEARIGARGAGVTSSEMLVLTFAFPLGIGLWSLLAGAGGGILRRVSERRAASRRGNRSGSRPTSWWACALEGAAVGLIAVAVALVGVRFSALPASIVATEAGAAVVGVFAGFSGIGFFVFLRRLVFREKASTVSDGKGRAPD